MRYPEFWQTRGLVSTLLAPLGWLVCRVARRRRQRATTKSAPAVGMGVPVVVVGNITVGGTGKTPLLMALIEALKAKGFHPGVVSRGYGARISGAPRDVGQAQAVSDVGDEPWLIHRTTQVPVVVHPDRLRAAQSLLQNHPETDVLLSDDGLQHHRLPRTVEIVVVDGERRFGNDLCLPAGPLREPLSVLSTVDLVAVNGQTFAMPGVAESWHFRFQLDSLRDLAAEGGSAVPLSDWQGRRVRAVAGIGHPERFFAALRAEGMIVEPYPLGDHQSVDRDLCQHLLDDGLPVVITNKDAVKWPKDALLPGRVFVAEGRVVLPEGFVEAVLERMDSGGGGGMAQAAT